MCQTHSVSHCEGCCRSLWRAGAAGEELQRDVLHELLEVLGAGDTLFYLTTFVRVVTCIYCYSVPPCLVPCLCWLCFWPWACHCSC